MNRPVRRYMEKFEASDLSVGTYHARKLPRFRCNNRDFLTYLNTYDPNVYDKDDLDKDWVDMVLEKDLE